jgi:hypothetical protein
MENQVILSSRASVMMMKHRWPVLAQADVGHRPDPDNLLKHRTMNSKPWSPAFQEQATAKHCRSSGRKCLVEARESLT